MEELANQSISRVPRITSGSSGDTLLHNTLRAGQLLVPRLEKSRDGVVTQIIGGERERKKSKWGVTLSAVELGQRHRGSEAPPPQGSPRGRHPAQPSPLPSLHTTPTDSPSSPARESLLWVML